MERSSEVEAELLRELGLADTASLSAVEYVQKCVVIYEQTLRAMGLSLPQTISQAVDSSQLAYTNPTDIGADYANLPEDY